ncbi:MAG: MotA/TolQ/ExbB proton channel family protein [Alphaproteobacteria bacterium]|nr:MotA/TolQ/ExbB proton channel family protein [Alphaproteobacteria bacterium]
MSRGLPTSFSGIFDIGGTTFYVLIALSIYVTAIFIYKVYQVISMRLYSKHSLDDAIAALRNSDPLSVENILPAVHKHPAEQLITYGLALKQEGHLSKEAFELELKHQGERSLESIQSHMKGLEFVTQAAPLLGLLGTVIGMVHAFAVIAASGNKVDPSMLAEGIWQALITTIAGLVIAIPALAMQYWLSSQLDTIRNIMTQACEALILLPSHIERKETPYNHGDAHAESHEEFDAVEHLVKLAMTVAGHESYSQDITAEEPKSASKVVSLAREKSKKLKRPQPVAASDVAAVSEPVANDSPARSHAKEAKEDEFSLPIEEGGYLFPGSLTAMSTESLENAEIAGEEKPRKRAVRKKKTESI